MIRFFLLSSLVLWLSACTSSTVVVTGAVSDAIEVNQVEVLYDTLPDCEFDVIALIKIPGEYYSRASLIEGFRQKAASVGAPLVQVTYLQQVGSTEYFGSARALRCQ